MWQVPGCRASRFSCATRTHRLYTSWWYTIAGHGVRRTCACAVIEMNRWTADLNEGTLRTGQDVLEAIHQKSQARGDRHQFLKRCTDVGARKQVKYLHPPVSCTTCNSRVCRGVFGAYKHVGTTYSSTLTHTPHSVKRGESRATCIVTHVTRLG